jgi:hypothetical protein
MSHLDTFVLHTVLTPDHVQTYPLLPFTVPPHTTRIDVRYRYADAIGSDPHLTGGSTIDIGIFDARGTTFLGEGFRGWSGSARSEFTLSTHDATPGYLPGPIQPGTWHICLGAYKVAAGGCPVEVEITLMCAVDEPPDAQFPARLPLSTQPRPDVVRQSGWYRGELHCHSEHSDGDSHPRIVIERAEALGLDFLAITDHNVLSQQVELAGLHTRLMLIPGMEVTTYRGHWNIWGAGDWIDFRVQSASDMQAAVNAALHAGYLISCNHPRPFGPDWDYPEITGFDCIEVWNGPWLLMNEIALHNWDTRLRAGARITAVGGSDAHFHTQAHPAQLAHPMTVIRCPGDPSPAGLLAGLRAGHAFITESPTGPEVYLSAGGAVMGDVLAAPDDGALFSVEVRRARGRQLEIVTGAGVVQRFAIDDDVSTYTLRLDVQDTCYVRAQVTSHNAGQFTLHALTNPIYIDHTPDAR